MSTNETSNLGSPSISLCEELMLLFTCNSFRVNFDYRGPCRVKPSKSVLRKLVINNDEDDADDDGNALSPTHKLCEYLAGDMRALTEYLP